MGFQEHTDNKYVRYIAGGILAAAAAYGLYKLLQCISEDVCQADDDYFGDVDREGGETKRVLVLGLDGSGKTQLVRCFRNQPASRGMLLPRPQPTLGFNILSVGIGGYSLNMWDVGGCCSYRPYWNDFLSYQLVDVIVWVVDSANIQRFQESRHALHSFLDNPAADRLPVIIVAAKQDLHNSASAVEVFEEMCVDRFRYNHIFNVVSTHVTPFDERKGIWRLFKLICNAKKTNLKLLLFQKNQNSDTDEQ